MIIDYTALNKTFILSLYGSENIEKERIERIKGHKDRRRQGCKINLQGMAATLQS